MARPAAVVEGKCFCRIWSSVLPCRIIALICDRISSVCHARMRVRAHNCESACVQCMRKMRERNNIVSGKGERKRERACERESMHAQTRARKRYRLAPCINHSKILLHALPQLCCALRPRRHVQGAGQTGNLDLGVC